MPRRVSRCRWPVLVMLLAGALPAVAQPATVPRLAPIQAGSVPPAPRPSSGTSHINPPYGYSHILPSYPDTRRAVPAPRPWSQGWGPRRNACERAWRYRDARPGCGRR